MKEPLDFAGYGWLRVARFMGVMDEVDLTIA